MSIGTQLRNLVMVRFADPEIEPVIDWCQANSARNAFDRDVLTYPATKVLAAHEDGAVINYMPIQGTAMLESIGPNPDATPLQIANGVMECVKAAALQAHGAGFRELYFVASDPITAEGAELMGFERLPFPVYRKKLG
jgi:hypothetical protein